MANEKHLKILKQGVKSWNKWREENPETRPDLYQAKLSEADLSSLNHSGAVFRQANLRKFDLREANLRKANLFEADLSKAVINKADLSGANLSSSNLFKARLKEAKLKKADLSGADLRKAMLSGADLRKAKFRGADLRKADLSGADLRKADLNTATLIKADLSGALLYGVDLSGADLSGAILHGAYLREANLRKANLRKADLSGVDLRKADLNSATLLKADLSGTVLYGADLPGADLSGAILRGAYLREANLRKANLRKADLSGAVLSEAVLISADLTGANLCGAVLSEANLNGAMFIKANLSDSNLSKAILVETNFNEANLTNSRVDGISAWDLVLNNTTQTGLIITQNGEPVITIDNLEVAQFVYLLLHNEKIRKVIDTIGEKGVLILGRFIEERKAVLDAIRDKLRELGFVPMMFDFEKPSQRDFTETIKTLAGLSRFIIADITNPKSSPLELQATMPDYMIPFVPIIQEDEEPFAMFRDLQQKYGDWVLDVLRYDSAENLLKVMNEAVIKPALKKADELLMKKAEGIRDRHVKDYM